MNERLDFLKEKASLLSQKPGVYLMKNNKNEIIYIGKAKSLRNRVSTYFQGVVNHAIKTYKLVENIYDFDVIITKSELDALVLEANLIKMHSPKYNILLKDAKGFNYIKITKGDFPKITYALQANDKNADYLGPFTSDYTVKQTVEEVNRIFQLPTCKRNFPQDFAKHRPCLNFHIHRCTGVCMGKISSQEYKTQIEDALEYIKNGSKQSIQMLQEQMNKAAEELDFELAAKLRDRIRAIEKAANEQTIISNKTIDFDIVAINERNEKAAAAIIKYRSGRLMDKENFYLGDVYEHTAMLSDFLIEYYRTKEHLPKEIYLDDVPDDIELIQQYFNTLAERKVSLITPKRGEMLAQCMLAKANAEEYLILRFGRKAETNNVLKELAKLLGLSSVPNLIESYDISNVGESNIVGGMITYKNGKPYRKGYRRFQIKTVDGTDDYASMKEMLRRRFKRYLDGDEGFSPLPDLILLDGGKGHLSVGAEVLREFSLSIPIFGMVKDDKHRTRAIASFGGEIEIKSTHSVFLFLTGIQDEVHRFTIEYQRKRHKKTTFETKLTAIHGIGDAKATAIMKRFKTKQALINASPEELSKVAKIPLTKANELSLYIKEIFS